MAITHTHPHDPSGVVGDHVTAEGYHFGTDVHAKLDGKSVEHTHEDVFEVYEPLTDTIRHSHVRPDLQDDYEEASQALEDELSEEESDDESEKESEKVIEKPADSSVTPAAE